MGFEGLPTSQPEMAHGNALRRRACGFALAPVARGTDIFSCVTVARSKLGTIHLGEWRQVL